MLHPSPPHITPPKVGKCQLLGPLSLMIQSLMGVLILMVLLLKRNYETPRRRLIIWWYDIIKQVGGSLTIHFLNIMLSIWKRDEDQTCSIKIKVPNDNPNDDQCDWYFLNLLMDTTVGLPILYVALHMVEKIALKLGIENIQSGDYFVKKSTQTLDPDENKPAEQREECISTRPPQCRLRQPSFFAFVKQFNVFIISLMIMKLTIYLMLNYLEEIGYMIANILIGWADPWPNFQLFLIMFICPILLNCFQYCCVDSIIKLHDIDVRHWDSYEPVGFDPTVISETNLDIPGIIIDDDDSGLLHPSGQSLSHGNNNNIPSHSETTSLTNSNVAESTSKDQYIGYGSTN